MGFYLAKSTDYLFYIGVLKHMATVFKEEQYK